jgi:hypothetical protein
MMGDEEWLMASRAGAVERAEKSFKLRQVHRLVSHASS